VFVLVKVQSLIVPTAKTDGPKMSAMSGMIWKLMGSAGLFTKVRPAKSEVLRLLFRRDYKSKPPAFAEGKLLCGEGGIRT